MAPFPAGLSLVALAKPCVCTTERATGALGCNLGFALLRFGLLLVRGCALGLEFEIEGLLLKVWGVMLDCEMSRLLLWMQSNLDP